MRDTMQTLLAEIEKAKVLFREHLIQVRSAGGLTVGRYVRYLSFQHHLTKGVQRHFFAIAAHHSLSGRRKFRDFLFHFGLEEEPHFGVAASDLKEMGVELLPAPLDVKLWWSFFDGIVNDRPFCRLGATCILENLGSGAGEVGHRLLSEAPFLNDRNTRFVRIHFHEELPHGDQILAALSSINPTERELADLVDGAQVGASLYLRLARWAMGFPEVTFGLTPETIGHAAEVCLVSGQKAT